MLKDLKNSLCDLISMVAHLMDSYYKYLKHVLVQLHTIQKHLRFCAIQVLNGEFHAFKLCIQAKLHQFTSGKSNGKRDVILLAKFMLHSP